ncbi:MAG: A/G-specific adenine glycosylase [Verrucomicrobiales bacterium]|jgi:A/G-specific adenine glycosylase
MPSDSKPAAKQAPLDERKRFQTALISWFRQDGKSYPWRETTDPYAILVSEMMLQQTQIATVLERDYYGRWMTQFPDISTLALAHEDAVLKAWEGLGYYRRARNLHRLAQVVHEEHAGILPDKLEGILALPGIGRYTAGAVLSFAHDQSTALVDGNVVRVFARLFDYAIEVDSTEGQKQMWAWAEALVPGTDARRYNSALMELGQTYCRQKQPVCVACPVSVFCQTRHPDSLPNKSKRRATVHLDEHVLFQLENDSLWLVQEQGKRRQGLWKLPECSEDQLVKRSLIYKAKYSITHYRVTLHVYESQGLPVSDGKWLPLEEIPDLAMPSPYRKAVDHLLEAQGDFRLG